MPAGPYAHQYIFLDFAKNHGRLLMARPGDDEPVAQRLWDAMADHYKGELRKPYAVTREDWPRFGKEWEDFLIDRRKGRMDSAVSPGVG